MSRHFLFILLGSFSAALAAQELSVSGQYGFLMPHHKAIEYSTNSHISGFEAWYFGARRQVSYYDSLYRYPKVGAGFAFTTLGNSQVFGEAYTLAGYFLTPFNRTERRFTCNYQLGFGLSYLSRVFSFESNMPNVAIGTHWNVFVRLGLGYRMRLSDRLALAGGFHFTHFSNGKMGAPNLGLNTLTANTGLNYSFTPATKSPVSMPSLQRSYPVYMIYSAGVKYPGNFVLKPFFISSLSINGGLRRSYKGYPQAGVDFFWDASMPYSMERDSMTAQDRDALSVGGHIGYDAVYKRFMATVQVGYLLYAPYVELTRMYSRIGFRYAFTPRLFGNVSIKAHYAVADFIEWGVGYYITDKYWK